MSLVAWYPLIANGNNQGLDGVNLTVNGSVTYTAGKLGNAATFVGTNTYFKRARFTEQKNFSVSAWVKCSATSSSAQYCFTQGRDINNDSWRISFSSDGTIMVFCIGNQNLSYNVTLNTWYHVAMTIDNDANYVFYLNGNVVKSGTVTTLPDYSESGGLMSIGAHYYASGVGYVLNGQVQDFRYYNHVISMREVKELAKGLCLHIPLDWGGNPNMIGNSYTWMNKALGTPNAASSTRIYTQSVIEDNTAPCYWVYKCQIQNTSTTAISGGAGVFYGYTLQGFALTDLVEGETYTYSFWAKSDSGIVNGFAYGNVGEGQTEVSHTGFGTLDSNWRKHTRTFKWTRTTSLTLCFYVAVPASSTVDFQVCGLKLEKGDKATPYIPKSTETAYTSYGYGSKFSEDCSGYNNIPTTAGTIVSDIGSPRNLSSTYFGEGGYVRYSGGFPRGSSIPNFTISLWYKPDIGKTFTAWYDVWTFWVDTESGNNTSFRLETENSSGNRYRIYYNNAGESSYGGAQITNITEKKWYHLAFTCNGTVIRQYVNGSEVSNFTLNAAYKPTNVTGIFRISDGQLYASYSDVRAYATTLSADDIKSLYQTGAEICKNGAFMTGQLVEE